MPQVSNIDAAEETQPPVTRAIWPPLLLILCVPVFFVSVYDFGSLAYPALCYIIISMGIAPAQLVYGLILRFRKHPRAGLHLGSSIALGCLLSLAWLVLEQIPSVI